jgi:hypothetical protein
MLRTQREYEFPVGPFSQNLRGPARIIVRFNHPMPAEFIGVVSHDRSRLSSDQGYMDHFQVHPRREFGLFVLEVFWWILYFLVLSL